MFYNDLTYSKQINKTQNNHKYITTRFAGHAVIIFRSLYWYEEDSYPGLGTLMTSKLNGTNVRKFFNMSDDVKTHNNCNCPESPQVAKPFVIDTTKKEHELFWVDPWVPRILAADMDGCHCRVVVNATEKKKYGFPPMSITVDSKYIYWFNSTEKIIYYTNKHKRNKIEQVKTSHGYKIMALDPGNQPYPKRRCLLPKAQNLEASVVTNSANSITLQLPPVSKPEQCKDLEYEMPATEYTVYYRLHTTNDLNCNKEVCPFIVTTRTEIILTELKPFTEYTVTVEATNYYAKLHEVLPLTGAPIVVKTAAEGELSCL